MEYSLSRQNEEQPTPSRWPYLGSSVHYLDYGGPGNGPLVVCVHGLGGSSGTWAAIAPALVRTCRVLAIDLAGFGRTQGNGRSVTVAGNQALLHRFLLQVAGTPAILVGHSMGGTIAALQASRNPETTAGLVLINPAVPLQFQGQINMKTVGAAAALGLLMLTPPAQPGRGLALEQVLRNVLRSRALASRQLPIAKGVTSASARMADGQDPGDFLAATRSLTWTLARRWRFAATLREVRAPVLLLHGDQDWLVPSSAVRAVVSSNPAWQFQVVHGIGHVPQLEAPEWTAERILTWLAADAAAAAEQAGKARPPRGQP